MQSREREVVTVWGGGTPLGRIALYAGRDDPFDLRFEHGIPTPNGYARLGEVDAGPDVALVECADGYRLTLGGREYDALAVAAGDAPVRLSPTTGAEAHARARVAETHAAAATLAPDMLAAQPRCPRHRAPCARCRPETPRARWLAAQGVGTCACEDEPCGCGVSAFLAATSVSTIAVTRGVLAILEAIDPVHGKA